MRTDRGRGLAGAAFLLGSLALGCTLVTAVARATPPGQNGRIAFTRYTDGTRTNGAIFTIGADGRAERRLTRPPVGSADFQPDWSFDGRQLVFQREYQTKPYETFVVNADGTNLHQVDPGCPPGIPASEICEENEPAFSPDAKRIAFAWAFGKIKRLRGDEWIEVGAIGVMDADGKNVRQLTQLRRPTTSEDSQPVWSPDGKRIAFVRLNSTARPHDKSAIFVVGADGTGLRQVTPWNLDAGDHPDWSPDAKRILFRSPQAGLTGTSLYSIRPDGTGLQRITHFASSVELLSSSYAPDGKWIVLARTGRAHQPDLFLIRPDGTGLRRLTFTTLWDSAPDWGPR
jgi:Tol biopolymer transport system component